jgi:hypothetical protein
MFTQDNKESRFQHIASPFYLFITNFQRLGQPCRLRGGSAARISESKTVIPIHDYLRITQDAELHRETVARPNGP